MRKKALCILMAGILAVGGNGAFVRAEGANEAGTSTELENVNEAEDGSVALDAAGPAIDVTVSESTKVHKYQVTVAWESFDFTYSAGVYEWDPVGLKWDIAGSGQWSRGSGTPDDTATSTVTVTNRSSNAVTVGFAAASTLVEDSDEEPIALSGDAVKVADGVEDDGVQLAYSGENNEIAGVTSEIGAEALDPDSDQIHKETFTFTISGAPAANAATLTIPLTTKISAEAPQP